MAFLVIGTGVGGSIIINNQIWHGAHLYGGEFGFMIIDGKQLSDLASPVTMAKSYNKKTGKDFDGKTVFELADTDDPIAQEEREKFLHALAVAIFNIQHSFDPEKIIIGGGGVCEHTCHSIHLCGGQRTICGSQFSPSTMWVLGIEHRFFSGLG